MYSYHKYQMTEVGMTIGVDTMVFDDGDIEIARRW